MAFLTMRFLGGTRVHARSLASQFLLQIGLMLTVEIRRETSRVSFLMCPFVAGPVVRLGKPSPPLHFAMPAKAGASSAPARTTACRHCSV
jgi:hypothetical protein